MEYDKLYDKLAMQRVNLIMEYIEQILSDSDYVTGQINFDLDRGSLIVEIIVGIKSFYRCFQLLDQRYDYLFYRYFFGKIYDKFADSTFIELHPLCRIIPEFSNSSGFGIPLSNVITNSQLRLNFRQMTKLGSQAFNEEGDIYNKKIEERLGRKLIISDIVEPFNGIKMHELDDTEKKRN